MSSRTPRLALIANVKHPTEGETAWQCAIQELHRDGFGNTRRMPRPFITIARSDSLASEPSSPSEIAEWGASLVNAPEAFLTANSADSLIRSFGERIAPMLGYQADERWPLLGNRDAAIGTIMRLIKLGSPLGQVPSGYVSELKMTDPDPNWARVIGGLQTAIERSAIAILCGSPFDQAYQIRWIGTVGSTSRDTYVEGPIDIDLLVDTRVPQARMDHEMLRRLSNGICQRICGEAGFAEYGNFVSPNTDTTLVLSDIGVRGKESLVARYDLMRNGNPTTTQHLVDITFGNLPQLTGYAFWFRRVLDNLPSGERLHLQREIRLAKTIFRKAGGLYGSENRAFRGHIIEQLIVQSWNYRFSGLMIGTLDNALRLIVEEDDAIVHNELKSPGNFNAYRRRFPVWHPGWWESEMGFSRESPGVDLLDMVGNGDSTAASQIWYRLCSVAAAHCELSQTGAWSSNKLVKRARELLAESSQEQR